MGKFVFKNGTRLTQPYVTIDSVKYNVSPATFDDAGTPINATNLNKMQDNILEEVAKVINNVYPVGSIYMSISDNDPSTLFGGTWEQIKDTFLLSAGDTYTAGSTGGESTHTLTVDEIPEHNHNVKGYMGSAQWSIGDVWYGAAGSGSDNTYSEAGSTTNTGGGEAHNNMPPYLTVYMWKRTA